MLVIRILIIGILSLSIKLFAQNKALLENYERTSVCFTLLETNEDKYSSKLVRIFPNITVNDKFNDHRITSLHTIPNPYSRQDSYYDHTKEVKNALLESKAPKLLVAKWFSLQADGSFSMDLIKERGVYNATDADIIKAKAKKRGLSALQDAGEALLDKTYIIAFDYINTETWDEFYDRQDRRMYELAKATNTVPKKYPRTKFGYKSELICYLYRLNWNDSISSAFYAKAWQNPSYFENMPWELTPVYSIHIAQVEGSILRFESPLTDDELAQKLLQNGAEAALIQFAKKYPHFRVRAPIYGTKPFRAKIGLKEDLKIDQKFFVYESSQNDKGEIKMKRKGVLRATNKITDNRGVSTGETQPSVFYQESGKKLYQGMIMEQIYDFGVSISAGYAQRTLKGIFLRMDYNTSKYFHVSQLKLFIEAQIGSEVVRFGNSQTNANIGSYHLMVGVSKEYCVLRNIHLEPFVAFQYDTTFINSLNISSIKTLKSLNINTGVRSFGITLGLRVPINILHNLQLVPSVSISSIHFSSDFTLFGEKLPNEMGTTSNIDAPVLQYKNTETNQIQSVAGQLNTGANLNREPIKWDISLRYKF
jgi:hypothetical protein